MAASLMSVSYLGKVVLVSVLCLPSLGLLGQSLGSTVEFTASADGSSVQTRSTPRLATSSEAFGSGFFSKLVELVPQLDGLRPSKRAAARRFEQVVDGIVIDHMDQNVSRPLATKIAEMEQPDGAKLAGLDDYAEAARFVAKRGGTPESLRSLDNHASNEIRELTIVRPSPNMRILGSTDFMQTVWKRLDPVNEKTRRAVEALAGDLLSDELPAANPWFLLGLRQYLAEPATFGDDLSVAIKEAQDMSSRKIFHDGDEVPFDEIEQFYQRAMLGGPSNARTDAVKSILARAVSDELKHGDFQKSFGKQRHADPRRERAFVDYYHHDQGRWYFKPRYQDVSVRTRAGLPKNTVELEVVRDIWIGKSAPKDEVRISVAPEFELDPSKMSEEATQAAASALRKSLRELWFQKRGQQVPKTIQFDLDNL